MQRDKSQYSSEQDGRPADSVPIQRFEPGTLRKLPRSRLLLQQLEEQRRLQLIKRSEEDEKRRKEAEEVKVRNEKRLFYLMEDLKRSRTRRRSNQTQLVNKKMDLDAVWISHEANNVVLEPLDGANENCEREEVIVPKCKTNLELISNVEVTMCIGLIIREKPQKSKFASIITTLKQVDPASNYSVDQEDSTIPSEVASSAWPSIPPDPGPALDLDYRKGAQSEEEHPKQRNNMNIRCGQSEDVMNEYANQFQKANQLQQTHYDTLIPEMFNRLQELNEKRARGLKEFIKDAADVESSGAAIIASSLEGTDIVADSINEKENSLKVKEMYQFGFRPPGDPPFEDLSKADTNNSQTHSNSKGAGLSHLTTQGAPKDKLKQRVGLYGTLSCNKNKLPTDVSPMQRQEKLMSKVLEQQQKVPQEQAANEGLMKMQGKYEANSQGSAPRSVDKQINECFNKLGKLQRYQKLLDLVNSQAIAKHSSQANQTVNGVNGSSGGGQRSSRHSNGISNRDHHDYDHVLKCILKEVADLACQREVVAKNLQLQVLQGITLLAKTLRDERKRSLDEDMNLTQNPNGQIASLDRLKRNYEKAFRKGEKSVHAYQKANADFNLISLEVEKRPTLKYQFSYLSKFSSWSHIFAQLLQLLLSTVVQPVGNGFVSRILIADRMQEEQPYGLTSNQTQLSDHYVEDQTNYIVKLLGPGFTMTEPDWSRWQELKFNQKQYADQGSLELHGEGNVKN